MGFIWWLIIGAIAGWLAGNIMKGGGFGLLGNIVVGIIGSLLGGFLLGSLLSGFLGSLLTALIGSLILLYLVDWISKRK
jgi:uncharacterized membrane protein YeaQ/YmgE (transglycosylase-associated protein family)